MMDLRTDDKLYIHRQLTSPSNYPSKKGLHLRGNWVNPIYLLKDVTTSF